MTCVGQNLIHFSLKYSCERKSTLTYIGWIALQFSIKLESGFLSLGNLSFSTTDTVGWIISCCEGLFGAL